MGRELRRVPPNWQHPKDHRDRYIPLLGRSYEKDINEWMSGRINWNKGFEPDYSDGKENAWKKRRKERSKMTWEEYNGDAPKSSRYMPDWPKEVTTHFCMYENTTEGTPISPVFSNIEDLSRWLANNGASVFADIKVPYEEWLAICKRGFTCGIVLTEIKSEKP